LAGTLVLPSPEKLAVSTYAVWSEPRQYYNDVFAEDMSLSLIGFSPSNYILERSLFIYKRLHLSLMCAFVFSVNPDGSQVSQRIARNSHYTTQTVMEEDIQMPRQLPPDVQHKTLQERIKVS